MGKNQDEYQTNLNLLLLDDLINFKNTVQVSYFSRGLGREFYTKNEFAICSFIQYKKIRKPKNCIFYCNSSLYAH